MNCPKCGTQTPDDTVLCAKCGFNIKNEQITQPKTIAGNFSLDGDSPAWKKVNLVLGDGFFEITSSKFKDAGGKKTIDFALIKQFGYKTGLAGANIRFLIDEHSYNFTHCDNKATQGFVDFVFQKFPQLKERNVAVSTIPKKVISSQSQLPGKTDSSSTTQTKTPKGCLAGCLTVIVLLVIIGLIMQFVGPCGVVIDGDTAMKNITISYGDVEIAAWNVAETVYEIAKKYDSINKVVISLYISKGYGGGLIDKYGNNITEDLHMGTITISDLGEVRKYKNISYKFAMEQYFKSEISRLNHAQLLNK